MKLGRWKSKSRHWWVGTATVGEGKSVAMKALADDMVAVLTEHSQFAYGSVDDRWHYQQSGTTAGAVDKLRTCNAYLCVYCPDAGRCLCVPAASGGSTDPHKFIDLEFFLDAAHGDEFNHSNKLDRQRVLQKPKQKPQAPVQPQPKLHLDPTNVTILFLQQDSYFQKYWARIARDHPVGIPQRCLFAFGGYTDPAPQKWNDFFESVTRPIVKDLFTQVVRRVGPRVMGADTPVFATTASQQKVVSRLEQIGKLYQKPHINFIRVARSSAEEFVLVGHSVSGKPHYQPVLETCSAEKMLR